MQFLHSFNQDGSRDSHVKSHETLTTRVESFSVIKSQSCLVDEKIYQIVMIQIQSSAIKPDKE